MSEVRLLQAERLNEWVSLWNAVQPHWLIDVGSIELEDGLRPVAEPLLRLVAEERGRLVGYGQVAVSDWGESIADAAYLAIGVERPHRRRGIGTRLALQLEAFARDRRIKKLIAYAWSDDFDGADPFLRMFGFEELEREQLSVQTPAAVDWSTLPRLRRDLEARGIAVTSFSAIDSPENRRRLHQAANEVDEDAPSVITGWQLPSFELFEARWFKRPLSLAGAIFVALDGQEIVGLSSLDRRPDGDLEVGLTGTIQTHRRRGIARVLKLMATEYAASHRARVHTGNATINEGMLAINRSLGFRPEVVLVTYEKTLPSSPSG